MEPRAEPGESRDFEEEKGAGLSLDVAQVVAWFRAHPDVFQKDPQAFEQLLQPRTRPAEAAAKVRDIRDLQVRVLKKQLFESEDTLKLALAVQKTNESTFLRLYEASLAWSQLDSPEAADAWMRQTAPQLLGVDYMALVIEHEALARSDQPLERRVRYLYAGHVAALFPNPDQRIVTENRHGPSWEIFADQTMHMGSWCYARLGARLGAETPAVSAASAAAAPAEASVPPSALVFGSRSKKAFFPGQFTSFLDYFVRFVSLDPVGWRRRAYDRS